MSLSTHNVILPDNKWGGGLIEQQQVIILFSTKACPRCNKLTGVEACVECMYYHPVNQFNCNDGAIMEE